MALNSLEIATQGLLFGTGDLRSAPRSLDIALKGWIQIGALETGVSEERTFTPDRDEAAFEPIYQDGFTPSQDDAVCVPEKDGAYEAVRQKAVSVGAQETLKALSDKEAWQPEYQPGKKPSSQSAAKVKK